MTREEQKKERRKKKVAERTNKETRRGDVSDRSRDVKMRAVLGKERRRSEIRKCRTKNYGKSIGGHNESGVSERKNVGK